MEFPQNRLKILDIWADPVDMETAVQRVRFFLEKGTRPHVVYAVNPEKNFSVPRSPALYQSFREADLLIPDGIGIVAAARLIYGVKISRVPGVELSERICALAAEKGYRLFIYRGREEVNRRAVEVLRERFPAIRIAGRANGYLPEGRMGELIERINLSGAEILFVALGSPRQELWVSRFKEDLKTVRVCQGIGGTLDTLAGTVRRAPEYWCRWNGEWLYRLLAEPRRIKRQRVLPLFAAQVLFLKFRNLMNSPA